MLLQNSLLSKFFLLLVIFGLTQFVFFWYFKNSKNEYQYLKCYHMDQLLLGLLDLRDNLITLRQLRRKTIHKVCSVFKELLHYCSTH